MKRKIRVVGPDGKALEGEYKVRDLSHLAAQIKFRTLLHEDKRRKEPKHKKKIFEEN